MIRGIYTGASGMVAEALRTDIISNNLANVNTAGYKKDAVVTKEFANMLLTRINDGSNEQIGSLGLGVSVDTVATNYSAGVVKSTGNDFDLAIDGKGFFAVQTPQGIRYTRNGTFAKNIQGELITNEGYRVLGENGPLTIKGSKMVVSSDGDVLVDGQSVGKLQIREFANDQQLTKEGASLYVAPSGMPAKAATGGVRQGFLEMSNVNVIGEMVNLISNYRAYEVNGKVVQAHDQLIGKAVNEVGKL